MEKERVKEEMNRKLVPKRKSEKGNEGKWKKEADEKWWQRERDDDDNDDNAKNKKKRWN